MKFPIFQSKQMLKLNAEVCDIDTKRGIYLTPMGDFVRQLDRIGRMMKDYGVKTEKAQSSVLQALWELERLHELLVVDEQGDQYGKR